MSAKAKPAAGHRSFNGAEKAAVILIALGNDLGARILQNFDPPDLKRVIDGANALGSIDKADLETLIQEFADRFARVTSLSGDPGHVRALLETAFPGGKLDSMLEGPKAVAREPVWSRFKAGSENSLAPYLLDEHPQVVAYVLSKLEGGMTAKLLVLLPRELRAAVAGRILKMQPVSEAATLIVEERLAADLLGVKDPGQEREAHRRLAAILNEMTKTEVDAILADLAISRPEEAKAVKALMFSFEDIVKLRPKAVAVLFDKVPTEQTIPALRGAPDELKNAVFAALGQRARRMAEQELARSSELTQEGIAARRAIAQLALSLAASGDIALPRDDDPPTDKAP